MGRLTTCARSGGSPGIPRRSVLAAPLATLAAPNGATESRKNHVSLEYRKGRLFWPDGNARAAVGKGGVRIEKKEGDGATPAGFFPLLSAMYRPDRVKPPVTDLPLTPLVKAHAWVDDPLDTNYNKLVELPYPAHVEKLWRTDAIYDLLVVIGYNINPTVSGAGSAIFLHIARPSFLPTVGCIAIERRYLAILIGLLGPGSMITIEP
jgi:L,D-peptidoglycan transpeptidase YkuD (ErfK/YbiS/YcfS/YnhG family)